MTPTDYISVSFLKECISSIQTKNANAELVLISQLHAALIVCSKTGHSLSLALPTWFTSLRKGIFSTFSMQFPWPVRHCWLLLVVPETVLGLQITSLINRGNLKNKRTDVTVKNTFSKLLVLEDRRTILTKTAFLDPHLNKSFIGWAVIRCEINCPYKDISMIT